MKKTWHYTDIRKFRCGTMICTHCKQEITAGNFKYRQSNDGSFFTRHRICSAGDLEWTDLDIQERVEKQRDLYHLRDCIQFRDATGTKAFDDDIAHYSKKLGINE